MTTVILNKKLLNTFTKRVVIRKIARYAQDFSFYKYIYEKDMIITNPWATH